MKYLPYFGSESDRGMPILVSYLNLMSFLFQTECDKCVHILLDDMDAMIGNTSGLIASVENIGLGRAAYNRLDVINRTAHDLAVSCEATLLF